jgi:hypothetical protein
MFDIKRFLCLINNCLIDEDKKFNEYYQVIKKNSSKTDSSNQTEFFASLLENLVIFTILNLGNFIFNSKFLSKKRAAKVQAKQLLLNQKIIRKILFMN